MALPSSLVLEIRTTGNDTNGGGFDPSVTSPGTDLSQSDSASVAYTDLVIGATTTQLTSAAHPFTSAHVGNTIGNVAGTGFTANQWLNIRSVSGGVATMDRSVGTAGSTGGTGNLGGAMASPGKVASLIVAGNTVHIRSGTYSCSASANVSGGRVNETVAARWVGYGTARLDYATRPVLQCGAASVQIWNNNGTGMVLDFLEFKGNAQTTSRGYYSTNGACSTLYRCKFSGFNNTAYLADFSNGHRLVGCEFTGNSSTSASFAGASGCSAVGCSFHDNTAAGLVLGTNCSSATRCVASGNSGASVHGFVLGLGCTATECDAQGNGGIGFDLNGVAARAFGCVSYGNTGYQFGSSTGSTSSAGLVSCAAGGGGAGNVQVAFIPATLTEGLVTLTADPFTAAASLNFAPNSAAGGGAAVRAAGYPATLPGLAGTSYPDVGAYQHPDPAASAYFAF